MQAQDRLPPIPAEKMTEAQKKAVAEYTAARGPLTGPWNVLLRSPELINRQRGVSDYVRFNSVLSPRVSEFIILITARHWAQQYVWNAHHPAALKDGLNPDIAKAVAEGRRPQQMAEDEEVAYDFIIELQRNHTVSDATLRQSPGEVRGARHRRHDWPHRALHDDFDGVEYSAHGASSGRDAGAYAVSMVRTIYLPG